MGVQNDEVDLGGLHIKRRQFFWIFYPLLPLCAKSVYFYSAIMCYLAITPSMGTSQMQDPLVERNTDSDSPENSSRGLTHKLSLAENERALLCNGRAERAISRVGKKGWKTTLLVKRSFLSVLRVAKPSCKQLSSCVGGGIQV